MNSQIISFTQSEKNILAIIKLAKGKNVIAKIDNQFIDDISIGTKGLVTLGEVNIFIPLRISTVRKNEKKVALVTGGSRGIGLAIATELTKKGFIVITNGRTGKTKGNYFQCDVAKYEQVEVMIATIIKRYQHIDVLINNAGIMRDKRLVNMSPETWNEVISANLTGTFNCTKAVIPYMQKQHKGNIVNISSFVARCGYIGQANYTASKGGIISFTKSIAKEYASDGILINAVAPGLIKTAMSDTIPIPEQKRITKDIPVGRLGKPEEIAKVVSFLVSSDASYITGQTIDVNGGLYM